MRLTLLLALSLLFAPTVKADDVAFLSYGVGVFRSADEFLGQNKIVTVGYRSTVIGGFYWQNKVGFWGEGSGHADRNASFFVSSGLGVEVDLAPVEFSSGWGIAAISSPDSQLGARFPQFNGDLYIGVRDKNGTGAGFQYNHISCASFCSPNQGRDFGSLVLSQKF